MGIERIGGGSAINISTPQKVSRPEIQVTDMGQASSTVKPDKVAPVTTESKDGYSQQGNQDRQDASVQSDKEISPDKVKDAVENLNKQVRHTSCSFKYHEETNRISITVKDKETDEIIREIPPEKALDMIAKAWELAGLMVDEKR